MAPRAGLTDRQVRPGLRVSRHHVLTLLGFCPTYQDECRKFV